jgi:hypothetical protein
VTVSTVGGGGRDAGNRKQNTTYRVRRSLNRATLLAARTMFKLWKSSWQQHAPDSEDPHSTPFAGVDAIHEDPHAPIAANSYPDALSSLTSAPALPKASLVTTTPSGACSAPF